MKFVQVKCPNCDATLEIENGIDTMYCKYCGTRIMLEGQSQSVIEAKTKVELARTKANLKKQRRELFFNYLAKRNEEKTKREAIENKTALSLFVIGGFLSVILILFESCGIIS